MTRKHIGRILDSVAENHAFPKVEIIERAGYASQSTYYKHIIQQNLSFRILYKYARAMNYNFSRELPEFVKWMQKNNVPALGTMNKEFDELVQELNKWKEKYYSLLEKYNTLLEESKKIVIII